MEVKLEDIDELYCLISDMSVLIYIHQLLRENDDEGLIVDGGNKYGAQGVLDYVVDRQVETLLKIWELLNKRIGN